MKPRANPPGAQGMKQYVVRVAGLIGMVLVPEFMAFVIRIEKLLQFRPKRFNLFVIKKTNPGHVSLLAEKGDLLGGQAMPLRTHAGKQIAYGRMQAGQIVG